MMFFIWTCKKLDKYKKKILFLVDVLIYFIKLINNDSYSRSKLLILKDKLLNFNDLQFVELDSKAKLLLLTCCCCISWCIFIMSA